MLTRAVGIEAMTPTPQRLGAEFALVLASWLKAAEFKEMRWRNRFNSKGGGCASHDYCDANMAMDQAMRNFGIAFDQSNETKHVELWNAAWDYAKGAYLTEPYNHPRHEPDSICICPMCLTHGRA